MEQFEKGEETRIEMRSAKPSAAKSSSWKRDERTVLKTSGGTGVSSSNDRRSRGGSGEGEGKSNEGSGGDHSEKMEVL